LKNSGNLRKLRADAQIFENRIGGEKKIFDSSVSEYCLISPKNAAQILDVSIKFIYERIQSGEIESICIGGRIKRIKKTALEKWLSSQVKKNGR